MGSVFQRTSWGQHFREHHGVSKPVLDKLTTSRGEPKTNCLDKHPHWMATSVILWEKLGVIMTLSMINEHFIQ